MQCTHCGSNVPDGATACPICGAKADPGAGMFKRPGDIGATGFSLSSEPVSPAYTVPSSPRCPTCGAPLSAADKFCTKCGAPSPLCSDDAAQRLSGSGVRVNLGSSHSAARASSGGSSSFGGSTPPGAPYTPPERPAPAYTPVPAPAPTSYVAPSKPSEPPTNTFLQGLCASPLYLVVTIFCTVFALFNVITSCKACLPTLPYLEGEPLAVILFTLAYSIVPIVCWVAGMWLLFASAQGSLNRGLATGGLTTIQIAFTISLVMEFLAIVYGLVKLVQSGVLEYIEYLDLLPANILGSLIGAVVGFLIGTTLRVVLEAKIILMNSATARALSYGTVSPIPSTYVGVMMFISGVLTFLLPFLLPFYVAQTMGFDFRDISYFELVGQLFNGMGALGLLGWLLNIAAQFLLGVLTFTARNRWQANQIGY